MEGSNDGKVKRIGSKAFHEIGRPGSRERRFFLERFLSPVHNKQLTKIKVLFTWRSTCRR